VEVIVAEKETAREKMLRKQQKLEAENLGVRALEKERTVRFAPVRALKNAVTGDSDFGTELSPAAAQARYETLKRKNPEYPYRSSVAEYDEDILRAGREAAKQEQREAARGMKKGGMTASKRADGIAQRGRTRGQMK
jgi:hypothetical protein